MTVREMIKNLVSYPMDWQVVDTDGSPIMFMCCKRDGQVGLEPKSQLDVESWLDEFFEQAKADNMSDNDAAQELKDQGFTINDLYDYRQDVYEWAIQTDVDW